MRGSARDLAWFPAHVCTHTPPFSQSLSIFSHTFGPERLFPAPESEERGVHVGTQGKKYWQTASTTPGTQGAAAEHSISQPVTAGCTHLLTGCYDIPLPDLSVELSHVSTYLIGSFRGLFGRPLAFAEASATFPGVHKNTKHDK